MCFSAAGSFAVSGALAGVGMATVARNASRPHRMFAAIPLLFAAQQAAEGVVWRTVAGSPDALPLRLAVGAFLGMALVVWPVWVPVSLRFLERDPARRRVLGLLAGIGGAAAATSLALLLLLRPTASVAGHSIRYDYAGWSRGPLHLLLLLAYAIPTVASFLVSTARLARTIGATLVVSLLVTIFVERDALTSVWCFFAAILSGLIWMAVGIEQSRLLSGPPVVPIAGGA